MPIYSSPITPATQTALSAKVGKGDLVINVLDYGAVGDGVTNDTAAIQAAVTAAADKELLFPAGHVYRMTTGGVTVNSPTRIRGSFAGNDGNPHGCVINTASGISGFVVNSDRVDFENIYFISSTNQVAADTAQTVAIKYVTGNHGRVSRCRFNYYWVGVWQQNCQYVTIEDCYFLRQTGHHLYIQNSATPDGGDHNVRGNWFTNGQALTAVWASGGTTGATTITFTTSPAVTVGSRITGTGVPADTYVTVKSGTTLTLSAATTTNAAGTYTMDNYAGKAGVRQESSGGVRCVGNKFIYGTVGYQLAIGDGMGTSILTVTGNSFELETEACIEFTSCTGGFGTTGGSTGVFFNAAITGNTFTGTKVTKAVLEIDPAAANQITDILFVGNHCYGIGGTTIFVDAKYTKRLTVTNNQFYNGLTAVICDGNSSDVIISPNHLTGITSTTYRADGQSGSAASPTPMDEVRAFTVSSSGAYSTITSVVFNAIGAAVIDVEVIGNLTGGAGGGLVGKFTRLASMAATGATPVLVTYGTDTVGGVVFNYQFVASANTVVFQLERGADGGTSISGTVRMTVRGSQRWIT